MRDFAVSAKTIRNLCLSFAILFSYPVFANNPCLQGACMELNMYTQGAWSANCPVGGGLCNEYISINGTKRQFYGRSVNGTHYLVNLPILNPSEVFQDGVNRIDLILGCIQEGTNIPRPASYTLFYWDSRGSKRLVCQGGFGGGINVALPCSNLDVPLQNLDADLAAQIEALKREIAEWEAKTREVERQKNGMLSEEKSLRSKVEESLNKIRLMTREIAYLTGMDFESIDIWHLEVLISEDAGIRGVFENLRAQVAHLREVVRNETQAAQQSGDLFLEELQRQFQGGNAAEVNLAFQNGPEIRAFVDDSIPPPGQPQANPQIDPLLSASDEAIERLGEAMRRGDGKEFLAIYTAWNRMQAGTTEVLQNDPKLTAVLHVANQAHQQVVDYVKTQIGNYGFFKQVRIPNEIQKLVGKTIRDWNAGYGQDLIEELNTWQENLTPVQQRVLGQVEAFGVALERLKDPRLQMPMGDPVREEAKNIMQAALVEGAEKLILAARTSTDEPAGNQMMEGNLEEQELGETDQALTQVKAGIHVALAFGDFLLGISPAGSIKDLFEAFSGYSMLSQNPLSVNERVFSATLGVVGIATLGTSNVIKGTLKGVLGIGSRVRINQALAGKAVRTGSLREIAASAERVIDSARKFGIKSKETMEKFVSEFKRIAGNNIGSVGHDIEEVAQRANRALHEKFLERLRREMGKPHVTDGKLQHFADNLYKPNAKIGSGSTAEAIRYERLFPGEKVAGRVHIEKGENYLTGLKDWLNRNLTASPGDRAAAENMIKDLEEALLGDPQKWR